ncbi:MAG: glycerol-3-phosphate acyltransferase [Pseudobutyrivibrio sp.]|nr:glycerol-3-phosphate acyltransferase [Pseudobutyrivibrio sp.]
MEILFSILIGYACGCFLTAFFVAKRFTGKDISEIGTGNPGMANVMARVGKFAGIMVLLGDITKTVLAMGLAYSFFGEVIGSDAMLFAGLGTLLGHNFPFWRHFKGGKGVAVTCTWIIIFMPFGGIVSAVAGGVIVLLTGLLPLGAVVIAAFSVPFAFVEYGIKEAVVMLVSALIMLYRNYPGFIRGFKNQEKREFKRERSTVNTIGTVATIIVVIVALIFDCKFL